MGDRRTGRNCGGRFRARNPCRRLDVFVLGEVQGLDERLAEIGEGGGGFGLHLTLGDSGEEASEGGAEIAGGHEAAGKVIGDVLAGFLAGKVLCLLAGVEGAEIGMAELAGNAAVAAVNKHERTQRGTVLGATWKFSRKKILILGFLGEPRGGEAYF